MLFDRVLPRHLREAIPIIDLTVGMASASIRYAWPSPKGAYDSRSALSGRSCAC